MNTLAIANQKGGTAKTTTAAALAVLLSRTGQPVHLIDMDPQASLTAAFGQSDSEGLLYQAMVQRGGLPVVKLSDTLTMTPSSIDLAKGESQFVQPGGFELRALAHLEQAVHILKERVNPGLAIVGGILTNCQTRRSINEQVREEVKRLYADLGQVRSDSKLLYATTEGSILQLKASNAMDDYASVLNRLIEVCPWLKS